MSFSLLSPVTLLVLAPGTALHCSLLIQGNHDLFGDTGLRLGLAFRPWEGH
jgi:hypothetical protein